MGRRLSNLQVQLFQHKEEKRERLQEKEKGLQKRE
jgi:hypothetical protein